MYEIDKTAHGCLNAKFFPRRVTPSLVKKLVENKLLFTRGGYVCKFYTV